MMSEGPAAGRRNRAPHLTLLRGGRAAGQPPSRPWVSPAAPELTQLAQEVVDELAEISAKFRAMLPLFET
jgi:hypothetical protein